MNKIYSGLAIAAMSVTLVACEGGQEKESLKPTTPSASKSNVQKLRDLIVSGCDWQPIASTLVGLAANAAASNSFDKVSTAFCDKVRASKAPASTSGEMTIKLNGFSVKGHFVTP